MNVGGLELTADDFRDGEVVHHDPATGITKHIYRIDDKTYAVKTVYPYTQEMLAACAEDRANSVGTRWGDGKIVGRIPLHLLTDPNIGLMDAIRNYDDAYIGRFLEDNPALKTRDRI